MILRAYELFLKAIICIYNTASTGPDWLLDFVGSSLLDKMILQLPHKWNINLEKEEVHNVFSLAIISKLYHIVGTKYSF